MPDRIAQKESDTKGEEKIYLGLTVQYLRTLYNAKGSGSPGERSGSGLGQQ